MTKPIDVYWGYGQGGRWTSGGIDQMANVVRGWNHVGLNTVMFQWVQWQTIVQDVNQFAAQDRLRLACVYSMSANAMSWILDGVTYQNTKAPGIAGCAFDFVVFIDPTWLSILTPLSPKTLRAGRQYHNYSFDPEGHGTIKLTSDFPKDKFEVIPTHNSHLLLDFEPGIQHATLNTFAALINEAEAVA